MRIRVGNLKHRSTRLHQNLGPRQSGRFDSEVRVTNRALSSSQVGERVVEGVLIGLKGRSLESTQASTQRGDLVDRLLHVECLIVDSAGKKHPSRKWSAPESAQPAKSTDSPKPTGQAVLGRWPEGHSVTIGLTLKKNPPSRKGKKGKKKKYKRPYVAVMIVSPSGKPVKTLALWVENKTKYDKELKGWYRMGSSYRTQTRRAVSRGTRSGGSYTLLWDGMNDSGKPVKPGIYGVFIEINREGGSYVSMKTRINCGASPDSKTMAGNNESGGAWVKYGPAK